MKKVVLAGIDSSTKMTGISFFENGEYKSHRLINLEHVKDGDIRLIDMIKNAIAILDSVIPDIIVIERMHQTRNVEAFRKLCKITGVIQYWCIVNDAEYIEVSPAEWRKGVSDKKEKLPKGREELKKWSIERVRRNYGLEVTDDESDSILIGQSYINKFKEYKEIKL